MLNIRRHICLIACLVILSAIGATPLWAMARTTPVEVMNNLLVGIDAGNNIVQAVQRDPWYVGILGTPNFNVANSPTVKIDGTTNTVKAAQSGTWSVGLTGTPSVAQSGTWNVGIIGTSSVSQSGTWNIGVLGTPNVNIANTPAVTIANTPSVSISNSPMVKIDPAVNTVDCPTKHNMIQLWATNQTLTSGMNLYSPAFSCAGYREVRALLWSGSGGANLQAYITFQAPTGIFFRIASTTWASGNIVTCQCPVYGDQCQIEIYNGLGFDVSIKNGSYAYLVN